MHIVGQMASLDVSFCRLKVCDMALGWLPYDKKYIDKNKKIEESFNSLK